VIRLVWYVMVAIRGHVLDVIFMLGLDGVRFSTTFPLHSWCLV
jgi:hypothetical protein